MARGLTQRIFRHAFQEGWIEKGNTVVDPFGGVCSTAIVGAYEGVRVVCVELESRFCVLGQRNLELHRRKWERLGVPQRIRGRDGELCGVSARVLARSKYAALGECYRRSPGGGVSSIYS